MTARQQLLDALVAERFTPLPTAQHSTNYRGPSAEYAALERQRLLWELAGEDDPETAVATDSVNAGFASFTAKDPHDPASRGEGHLRAPVATATHPNTTRKRTA